MHAKNTRAAVRTFSWRALLLRCLRAGWLNQVRTRSCHSLRKWLLEMTLLWRTIVRARLHDLSAAGVGGRDDDTRFTDAGGREQDDRGDGVHDGVTSTNRINDDCRSSAESIQNPRNMTFNAKTTLSVDFGRQPVNKLLVQVS